MMFEYVNADGNCKHCLMELNEIQIDITLSPVIKLNTVGLNKTSILSLMDSKDK